MKKFTLFIGILVVGSMVFAQRLAEPQHRLLKMTDTPQNYYQKTPAKIDEVAGDIIFEEYFDSTEWHTASNNGVAVPANMPAGWSVFDATENNFFWRWTTLGPRGAYTSINDGSDQWWTVPRESSRIRSTSDKEGDRGFMTFELAFFNTTSTGGWPSAPIQHDSYIQLPPIETTENAAVNIRFEQYHRFCCASYSAQVGPKMYISNDNDNWVRYDVDQATVNSTPATNPSVYEMSISSVAANQSTVYVRIHIKAETAYFWQIDDIVVYEPYSYDIRVMNYWVDYNEGKWGNYFTGGNFTPSYQKRFTGTPYYNPYYAFQKIVTSRAIAINFGGESFPETIITTKVVKEDGTILDEKTSAIATSIAQGEFDTSFVATHNFQIPKTIESVGSYYYEGIISGAEEDQVSENNLYRYDFNITENVFGYANPKTASTDRQSISGYLDSDGDGIGVIFHIDPPTEVIPGTETPAPYVLRGINTHINNDGYNWEFWRAGNVAYLTAEVYESDSTGYFDLYTPVISSASTPIDSTMVDSWVFLPFISDETAEYITPTVEGQEYLAVIRFYTGSLRFFIGADKITQPSFNSNMYVFNWGGSLGWTAMEANVSMELIVDKYGESPTGEIKVTVLQKTTNTKEVVPLYGIPVEIRVPNISENGELAGINFVTQTTDANGIVTLDSLRSGSYAVVATLLEESGTIAVDEEGNPIKKLTGVTVQGSGVYEVTIVFDNMTSINEQNLLHDVKLYPVPSNNTVTIESPVNISRIVVSNIVGQVVQTIENPTQVQTVSVANYATGVYLVTLFDNNGNSTTQRLIKH